VLSLLKLALKVRDIHGVLLDAKLDQLDSPEEGWPEKVKLGVCRFFNNHGNARGNKKDKRKTRRQNIRKIKETKI